MVSYEYFYEMVLSAWKELFGYCFSVSHPHNEPYAYTACLISRNARVEYFAKQLEVTKIPELYHKIVIFYKCWSALLGVPALQARVSINIVSFLHLALLELASSLISDLPLLDFQYK